MGVHPFRVKWGGPCTPIHEPLTPNEGVTAAPLPFTRASGFGFRVPGLGFEVSGSVGSGEKVLYTMGNSDEASSNGLARARSLNGRVVNPQTPESSCNP